MSDVAGRTSLLEYTPAVRRTDVHVGESELPRRQHSIIPRHEVVGTGSLAQVLYTRRQ
jgi:hypothetical protein